MVGRGRKCKKKTALILKEYKKKVAQQRGGSPKRTQSQRSLWDGLKKGARAYKGKGKVPKRGNKTAAHAPRSGKGSCWRRTSKTKTGANEN